MFPCEAKMPPKGTYNQRTAVDRRSSVNDAKVRLRRSIRRGTSSTAGINRLRVLASEATGCDVPLTSAVGRLT
ncbi:MAG: hypothetical protein ACTS5A_02675 [Candidatus Hodgkinia cicadicola]